MKDVFSLTPGQFVPHTMHGFDQNFRETNCYIDLVVELVNAAGLDPVACLGYTLAADFEGDQWTFGKPSHHDLELLYGIRIEELSLYKSLTEQIVLQVGRQRVPLLEADAFYLPDTAGIDYQTSHAKTTIGITAIDVERKTLNYFHNAAFATLEGDDFTGVLNPPAAQYEGYLPPYCEYARMDEMVEHSPEKLKSLAFECARFHLNKRPTENPIRANAVAMVEHQNQIIAGGESAYHKYTFVALRQLGASHQFGAHFLRWLDSNNQSLVTAATAFDEISATAKTLVLKLARVAYSGKPADLSVAFETMAANWDLATSQLNIALTPR